MKNKGLYTKKEIDFIRKNYGKITQEEIGKRLTRSLNSIKFMAYKLRKKGEKLYSELDHSKQQIEKMKEKKSFPLKDSIYNNDLELAYIIGVLNGDGCLCKRRILLVSIDKDFSLNFKNKLEIWSELKVKLYKYNNTKSHIYRQGFHYETMLNSIKIKKFLMQFYVSKNKKAINNIDKFLNESKLQIYFIEGFFDSEGTIKKEFYRIRISNSNKHLLELIKKYLKKLMIDSKIYKDKKLFVLSIQSKKDVINFCKIFNSSIKRKQDRILKIRNSDQNPTK